MKVFEKGKVFNVPNLLSIIRLLMIPAIIGVYLGTDKPYIAAWLLLVSWATDAIDGPIARRFGMVTELGKALDPVADKLTQIAVVLCLAMRFKTVRILFFIMLAKELFVGITSLFACKKADTVLGADWHGKLATSVVYPLMIIHLFVPGISEPASTTLCIVCAAVVILSGILYGLRNFNEIRAGREELLSERQ